MVELSGYTRRECFVRHPRPWDRTGRSKDGGDLPLGVAIYVDRLYQQFYGMPVRRRMGDCRPHHRGRLHLDQNSVYDARCCVLLHRRDVASVGQRPTGNRELEPLRVPNPNHSFELRLKYCGFTRLEDVQAAIDVGVSAIGLNFYPKSKRFVGLDVAERLSRCAEGQILRVGVFVNASPIEVERIVLDCGLDLVQLHGDETVAWTIEAAQRPGLRGVGILRAMPYRGPVDDDAIGTWSNCAAVQGSAVRGILIDAYDPVERGGTGRMARWDLLYPRPRAFACGGSSAEGSNGAGTSMPMILAGGITADNVEQAMQIARPDGVDVASGIETIPGIKDPVLMRRIAERVHRFYERTGD